jgi:cytochrome c oxidase cbb3-type subunit 3
LTDDVWLYGGDTATLRDVITNGRSNQMPGFADVLSAEQIAQMTTYITTVINELGVTE